MRRGRAGVVLSRSLKTLARIKTHLLEGLMNSHVAIALLLQRRLNRFSLLGVVAGAVEEW